MSFAAPLTGGCVFMAAFVRRPTNVAFSLLLFLPTITGGGPGMQGKGQIWMSLTLFPALLLFAMLKLFTLSLLLLLLLALFTTFAPTCYHFHQIQFKGLGGL